jgi:hypothetical protein
LIKKKLKMDIICCMEGFKFNNVATCIFDVNCGTSGSLVCLYMSKKFIKNGTNLFENEDNNRECKLRKMQFSVFFP